MTYMYRSELVYDYQDIEYLTDYSHNLTQSKAYLSD